MQPHRLASWPRMMLQVPHSVILGAPAAHWLALSAGAKHLVSQAG